MSVDYASFGVDEWRDRIANQYEPRAEYLIPILQLVQGDAGYLPPEGMLAAARHLRIPESKVYFKNVMVKRLP